jgi:hypothetical protein
MKTVVRSVAYLLELEDIDRHIARSNPPPAGEGVFRVHANWSRINITS